MSDSDGAPKAETRPDDAVDFLKWWRPEGPWVLTAIAVDQKRTTTETFRPESEKFLRRWIEDRNAEDNVYFHVNPLHREVQKKASREDVAALAWLHVDVDPREGEDLAMEQARALALLKNPPGDIPPPTAIVFSGGGYQGFWRLEDPFEIGGNVAKAEEAARFNLQLENVFGGDNCHNVDRIMRVPGTVNWPNRAKRNRGRKPALARVILVENDRIYPLSSFMAAPTVQGEAGALPAPAAAVNISANVPRLGSIDELPDSVPDAVKVLIVQGHDPDEPDKYVVDGREDRSRALFAAVCELVRAKCTNEVIYSVITDKRFAISASVLDKGRRARAYAIRQIRQAREHAIHPKLLWMNERHAIIGDVGGNCRVVSEVHDHALGRPCLSFQTFQDIRNRYFNRKVVIKQPGGESAVKRLGHWWLGHKMSRSFDTLGFVPGKEVPGMFNLWRGFNCEAIPGDCDPFLEYVRDVVCDGSEANYDYLIRWMARACQHPDTPGYSAVVLRGDQGAGKTFFAQEFGKLWGHHYLAISDPKHLVGSFNAHLRDCVILFSDEAFYAKDRQHASILKNLISADVLTVEAKYVNAGPAKNCIHLIMASDQDHIIPAGVKERRFFVLETSRARQDDRPYFAELEKQMDEGGRGALLHYLLQFDLSGFQVRDIPQTSALQKQRLYSFSDEEEWWHHKLVDGRVYPEHSRWERRVYCEELTLDYVEWMKRFTYSRQANATKLGHFLKRALPGRYPRRVQLSDPIVVKDLAGKERNIARPFAYELPTLEDTRAHWDENFGGPYSWEEAELVSGRAAARVVTESREREPGEEPDELPF